LRGASWGVHREWLTIRLRTPWQVGEVEHRAGSLLVTRLDDFVAGGRELAVLFCPDERSALRYYEWTRNHLILASLVDVHSRLEVLTPGPGGWRRAPMPEVRQDERSGIVATDPDLGDDYLLVSESFLRPATLRLGRVGGAVETLKRAPALFDAEGGDYRAAIPVYRRLVADIAAVRGADAPLVLDARLKEATCHALIGAFDEALRQLLDLLGDERRVFGEDDSRTLELRRQIGLLQLGAGRHREAEETLTDLLGALTRRHGTGHAAVADVRGILDDLRRPTSGGAVGGPVG
jgi:hypothetical protein